MAFPDPDHFHSARPFQIIMAASASSPRPAKAPPAFPKAPPAFAKAPPAEVIRMYPDQYPDLSEGIDTDLAPAVAANTQPQPCSGSNATPVRENPTPNHIEAQGEGSSSSHNPSEPPTTGSQGTAGASSDTRPAAHQQVEAGPWADFEDTPIQPSNPPSTQHPTGDVRRRPEVTLRSRTSRIPRHHLWASSRFDQVLNCEHDFLKAWLMALQDHDFGSIRVWKQYCQKRRDGTLDPYNHDTTFIREFLFIYGSQQSNFFTQNPGAGILPAGHERYLLRESAEAYHATHVNYAPPHSSTTWPPEPVLTLPELLAAPATQQNATREDGRGAGQPNAAPWHPQHIPPAVVNQPNATPQQASWHSYSATTHHGWQSTPQWSWWQDNQTAGWDWNTQPGWTATWHWG